MTVLNANGEVADFVNVSQFHAGLSAFECVAYAASLCKFAGPPGHGPTGSGTDVENTANAWYTKLEGSDAASNTNGMGLQAEYTMLHGLGLHYFAVTPTAGSVRAAVEGGYAVLLCGAETGMVDMAIGRVPYSWKASGNHAIVVSGIAPDGVNFLVRDTANIGPAGLRPDPRTYSAGAMQIVSATAVTMPVATSAHPAPTATITQEEIVTIDLNNPEVARYFELDPATPDGSKWKCRFDMDGKGKQPLVGGGILQAYRGYGNSALCGLTYLGLPLSNEIAIDAHGNTKQFFERGVLFYDPKHVVDNPPGAGPVYPAHLYTGVAQDPRIGIVAPLQAQVASLQAELATIKAQVPVSDPAVEAHVTALEAQVATQESKIAAAVKALS